MTKPVAEGEKLGVVSDDKDGPRTDRGNEFAVNVIEQVFTHWVVPELERRGLPQDLAQVTKALVVMMRDQPVQVRLNSEFVLATSARTTRDIKAGEPVTAADIADIESMTPEGVDPDAAWIAYLALADGRAFVSFTFLYERGKARALLADADAYLLTAQQALGDGNVAPALENANAAAELALMAQMRVHLAEDDPRDKHKARYRWFDSWVGLGNAQDAHAKAVRRLAQLRPYARYGDSTLVPKDGEAPKLIQEVAEYLIEVHALVDYGP